MEASTVSLPSQHAEVAEIWPRAGQILVHGTVGGADYGERALVARTRTPQEAELRFPAGPAEGCGGRFEACIPLDRLAAACDGPEQVWDLYLARTGSDGELRLGRHLDDVVGKKKIFTYPAQTALGMWVEPYYTIKENLSIICRRETV